MVEPHGRLTASTLESERAEPPQSTGPKDAQAAPDIEGFHVRAGKDKGTDARAAHPAGHGSAAPEIRHQPDPQPQSGQGAGLQGLSSPEPGASATLLQGLQGYGAGSAPATAGLQAVQAPQVPFAPSGPGISVTPDAPATPGVPLAHVPVEIARHIQGGSTHFDIRLDPPELGRIDVKLELKRGGEAVARLVVERSETLDLLMRDARHIERALQDAGVRSDGGLQFSLRDPGSGFAGSNFSQHGAGRHGSPSPGWAGATAQGDGIDQVPAPPPRVASWRALDVKI